MMEPLVLGFALVLLLLTNIATAICEPEDKTPIFVVALVISGFLMFVNSMDSYPKVQELVELKSKYGLEMTEYELGVLLKLRKEQLTLDSPNDSTNLNKR